MPTSAPTRAVKTAPRFVHLLRDSAAYSLGPMVGKVAGLLLLPIVTRRLAPDSFGRLEVFSAAFSAVAATLLLGLDLSAARLFPTADSAARKRIFSGWLLTALAMSCLVGLVGIFLPAQVSHLLVGSGEFTQEARLLSPIIAGSLLLHVSLGVLRNEARAWTYALFSTTAILGNAILVVILVVRTPAIRSVLQAQAAGTCSVAIIALLVVRRSWWARPSGSLLRELLRVGAPLAPIAAMVAIGDVISRGVVLRVAGPEQAGFMSVAVRIGSVLLVVAVALQTGWHPRVFALAHAEGGREKIGADIVRIAVLAPLAGAFLAIATPLIVAIVSGAEYSAAVAPSGWFLIAAMGFVAAQLGGVGLLIDGKSSRLTTAAFLGVFVTVLATFALAGPFGAVGGAAAAALGQWTFALAVWIWGRHTYRPKVSLTQLLLPSVAGAAVALSFTAPGIPIGLGIGTTLVMGCVALQSGVVLDAFKIAIVEIPDRLGRKGRSTQ